MNCRRRYRYGVHNDDDGNGYSKKGCNGMNRKHKSCKKGHDNTDSKSYNHNRYLPHNARDNLNTKKNLCSSYFKIQNQM